MPSWPDGAAVGGTIFLGIVLAGTVKLVGLLPLLLSDAYDIQYSFTGAPPPGATVPAFADFSSGSMVFSCNSASSGKDPNLFDVTCRATDTDASGMSRLMAEIDERQWDVERHGGIEMVLSEVPAAWSIAIVGVVYVLLAWGLVRATAAGWGWSELRSLRWKTPVYLIAPIALATALGALAGLLLYSDEGFSARVEASSADPLMTPAALLFLTLAVLAAVPEEALFRGWLHERLFSQVPSWVAYLVVAGLFVLMHVGGIIAWMFSGGAPGTLVVYHVVVMFLVSLLLTWIRRSGGSVLLCILAHAIYNAAVITATHS